MRLIKLLILLLIMAVGAVFAVLNADFVQFNYYYGSIELPLSLIIAGAIFLGAVLGVIVAFFLSLNLKQENAQLRYQVDLRSKEIDNLRALPIRDR